MGVKGSGNFGHAGRPGKIGGSSVEGSPIKEVKSKTVKKKDLSTLEDEYYKVTDKVDGSKLYDDLYDFGDPDADEVRFAFQVIDGHYGALIHDEVTTDEYRQEYKDEITDYIAYLRRYSKAVKKEGWDKLQKRVDTIVDFIEDNLKYVE